MTIIEKVRYQTRNMERVKKLYSDEKSFNMLMNRIIDKDYHRFENLISGNKVSNMWRILFIILDIVLEDGDEIPPYDSLTKSYPSRNLIYMNWTFSWVHGENTIISIFDTNNELIYRF